MNKIEGQPGEVHMTVHITRKATGKVETYELVGKVENDPKAEEPKEAE